MATAKLEDNMSESEDSRSDNEDFVDELDDNDLENLVRDIFGDSDSENEDHFEGFVMEMPDNVNWTFRGQPVQEQDDMFIQDQLNAGPTIYLDQNTKPVDIFKLFFTDEIINNIVDWTNRNYARKRRLHLNKYRGKWADINPHKNCAALAMFIIMKEGADNSNKGDLGKMGLVCVHLLCGLQHRGFQVYFDNFYTSVPLFYYLSSCGNSACGTIRTNCKFFLKEMLSDSVPGLTRGEFVWASYKDLLALT